MTGIQNDLIPLMVKTLFMSEMNTEYDILGIREKSWSYTVSVPWVYSKRDTMTDIISK